MSLWHTDNGRDDWTYPTLPNDCSRTQQFHNISEVEILYFHCYEVVVLPELAVILNFENKHIYISHFKGL